MNPTYPYIDAGTGCKITGMIAVADNYTKIVAGHGPLGNIADLTKSRDILITLRDRVQKLKSAQEAVAEKAFVDLDPVWGQGIINSDQWIQIVYLTV
jgi:cyclase